MAFTLPELPFAIDALEPHISRETLEYHYGKHHRAYVDKLNELVKGTQWENKTLEDIVRGADGAIFNNGAQAWNHTLYWSCMRPGGATAPQGQLAEAVKKHFGGLAQLQEAFSKVGLGQFGSGWAWLATGPDGKLEVLSTSNAGNPLQQGKTPLLGCDVWEHAYYLDYRNQRGKYLEAFWKLVNWDVVGKNLAP
jgi:Fe-Mn family superoxide dismutase